MKEQQIGAPKIDDKSRKINELKELNVSYNDFDSLLLWLKDTQPIFEESGISFEEKNLILGKLQICLGNNSEEDLFEIPEDTDPKSLINKRYIVANVFDFLKEKGHIPGICIVFINKALE